MLERVYCPYNCSQERSGRRSLHNISYSACTYMRSTIVTVLYKLYLIRLITFAPPFLVPAPRQRLPLLLNATLGHFLVPAPPTAITFAPQRLDIFPASFPDGEYHGITDRLLLLYTVPRTRALVICTEVVLTTIATTERLKLGF